MTFFYDLNQRLANIDKPKTQTLTESTVAEKIEPPIKTDPSERGKYKGQGIDDLKKQMSAVKDRMAGYKQRGEKVPDELRGKFSELTFAIRAKQAHGGKWGKIKEDEVDEGPEVFKLKADAARQAGKKEFQGPDGKTYPVKEGNDGNLANNAKPYDKVTRGDVIAGRLGKDEMGGKAKKIKEQGVAEGIDTLDIKGLQKLLAWGTHTYPTPILTRRLGFLSPSKLQKVSKLYSLALKTVDEDKKDNIVQMIDSIIALEAERRNDPWENNVAEGWDDMLKAVDKRRSEVKAGHKVQGAKGEIEKTATGVKHTRRYDAKTGETDTGDDAPAPGEKRGRGRPKKTDRQPERVTAKAYKHKHGRMEEGMDDDMAATGYEAGERGEYDREGDMAKEQLHTIEQAAQELKSILSDEENLPEWVQSKITKAMDYVDTARDYMLAQHDDRMNERELTGSERKEKERVFKKHMKPQMASFKKRYGKDEGEGVAHAVATNIAKGVKMGKKKEESVEETTTSGSMATSTAEPKGKKSMSFGKGIYDSVNREVENLIAESMSINASMNMDQHGGPTKSLTVTATDEDAEKLAALLMMAGLGGQGGCPTSGAASCGCEQQMDEAYGDTNASENKPDWPTAQEGSDDALQYSGGLNKPKVTGQTTVPVTGVQPAQSPLMYEDSEFARMMEMAGIDKSQYEPYLHTMKEDNLDEGSKESVVKKEPTGFSATAPAGKRLSVSMSGQPLKPSDVKVVDKKDMDENLVVTPAPQSSSSKPTTPAKPAPAPKPAPAGGQTMGTIKGGVWTADPPKKGEKGVPVPVPVDEKVNEANPPEFSMGAGKPMPRTRTYEPEPEMSMGATGKADRSAVPMTVPPGVAGKAYDADQIASLRRIFKGAQDTPNYVGTQPEYQMGATGNPQRPMPPLKKPLDLHTDPKVQALPTVRDKSMEDNLMRKLAYFKSKK